MVLVSLDSWPIFILSVITAQMYRLHHLYVTFASRGRPLWCWAYCTMWRRASERICLGVKSTIYNMHRTNIFCTLYLLKSKRSIFNSTYSTKIMLRARSWRHSVQCMMHVMLLGVTHMEFYCEPILWCSSWRKILLLFTKKSGLARSQVSKKMCGSFKDG